MIILYYTFYLDMCKLKIGRNGLNVNLNLSLDDSELKSETAKWSNKLLLIRSNLLTDYVIY